MKLRFLVDEDCPLSLETLLKDKGHDAIHVKTSGLSGTKDPEIFIFAQKEQRIIVSRDLGWSNIKNYPPNTHCGLIILRFPFEPTFSRLFRTKNNICRRKRQETAKLDSVYRRV